MVEMFSLDKNSFHLLGASPSDPSDVLQERLDDAILDGDHDEAALGDALRRLTSPKTRIEAELGWLLDLSQPRAAELVTLLAKLRARDEKPTDWTAALGGLSSLSKANVLADIGAHAKLGDAPLGLLIDAWDRIDVPSLEAEITSLRRMARQPAPDRAMLVAALDDLRRAHVVAALAGMAKTGRQGRIMSTLAESAVARNDCGRFLSQLAERYDAASKPALDAIAARIDETVAKVRKAPDDAEALLAPIRGLLDDWDEINQPIQLLEQLRGHEEGQSRALAQNLRKLALWLANDQECFEAALLITDALLATFPELDETAAQLINDGKTLREIVAGRARFKPLNDLKRLCEAAAKDPADLMRQVRKSGFSIYTQGQAGQIAKAFQAAAAVVRNTDLETAPWGMLRTLVRHLIAVREAGDVAHMIVTFMLQGPTSPSQTIKRVLTEDRTNAALMARRNRQSLSPTPTPTPAPASWAKAQVPMIAETREKGGGGGGGWFFALVAVAVGIGYLLISNPADRPTRPALETASAPYVAPRAPTIREVPAPIKAVPTEMAASRALASVVESIPPVGRGRTLDIEELRWCTFESFRIDGARILVDKNRTLEILRFNAEVNFLNERCGAYTYIDRDKRVVDAQLTSQSPRLRAQVRDWIAAGRAPRVAPVQPPPLVIPDFAPAAPTTYAETLTHASACAERKVRLEALNRFANSSDERDWYGKMHNAHLIECYAPAIPTDVRAAARRIAEGRRGDLEADALNMLSLRRAQSGLELRDPSAARRVQSRLAELGFYAGPIDGAFGRGSTAALRAFKRSRPDLRDDDGWDADTAAALFKP
jgi:hypothetical protein